MDVAMVGLGNIGGRMAARLRDMGHSVVGHDVRPGRAAELGLAPAAGMADACRRPVVLLSLPSDAAIDAVVLGPDGVGAHAAPGTVVVDLSTASPERTRRRHAALAERGVELLDAGVSGGPRAAEAGTLTLMAGGSPDALEAARPVLAGLGERIFHVGGPGTGHAAKAVNNFLNAANLAATAEAMVVGTKAGLDPVQLLEIVNASSGRNWATEHRFPSILAGDYLEGGLSNALMAKDLDVYLDLAAGSRAPTLLGATCRSMFGVAMATGYADRVSNTVVDALGDLAGGVRVQPGAAAGAGGGAGDGA
jgi:3-hydroxyisobutyrate dehydrogenase-like beta-hydroxyacid dehydrogenase